jgi:hypothetical protein
MIPANSQRQWGPWKLDKRSGTLSYEFAGGGAPYWIDLPDCISSAVVLDAICQIAGKKWATDDIVAGLARALNDILEPQANLCSGGNDKRLTRPVLAKALRRVKVAPVVPAQYSLLEMRRRLAPCLLSVAIDTIEKEQ